MDNNEEKNEMQQEEITNVEMEESKPEEMNAPMENPEPTAPDMPNNDMNGENPEGKQTNKVVGIILGALIFILIIALVCAFTLGGKSKGEKFLQLLIENQRIAEVFNSDKKYANSKMTINVDDLLEDMGASGAQFGKLVMNSKNAIKDDNYTSIVTLSASKLLKDDLELQIAQNGEVIGFKIDGLTDKFVAIDMGDINGLMENLEELGIIEHYENDVENEEMAERLQSMILKYGKVVAKNLSPYIKINSRQKLTYDGNSTTAEEQVLSLRAKDIGSIAVKVLKEFRKNKNDIKELYSMGLIEDVDEFIEQLDEMIQNGEESVEDLDDTEGTLYVKLYVKNNKTIATEISFIAEDDSDEAVFSFGMYYFENSDQGLAIVTLDIKGNQIVEKCTISEEDDVKSGTVKLEISNGKDKVKLSILKFEIDESPKDKAEIIKLNKKDMLLLNTATEDDIEDFVEDFQYNLQSFAKQLGLQ